EVEYIIGEELLDLNVKPNGNPLVPYEGQGRGFRIIDTKFINHKWVLANFTDNDRWGDVLIRYDFDADKNVTMETVTSVLYDRNRK
ncbi:MAG: hydrolase, partial [Nonlabens sp.]